MTLEKMSVATGVLAVLAAVLAYGGFRPEIAAPFQVVFFLLLCTGLIMLVAGIWKQRHTI